MAAPAAKRLKLTDTKRANNDLVGAPQPQSTEMSAAAEKLKLFLSQRAIDDVDGTINRTKALSARFTNEQLKQTFEDLESMLELLIGHTAWAMTEYQRLGWVLEQANVELVAPDDPSHELPMADFKAICKIVMPEVPSHELTLGDLEVLRSFVAAMDGPSHEPISTDLGDHHSMQTTIERLTGELRQVREELAQAKTDCAAETAEAKHFKDLVYLMHDELFEAESQNGTLLSRCEAAEAAIALMSDRAIKIGYHQCRVCLLQTRTPFFRVATLPVAWLARRSFQYAPGVPRYIALSARKKGTARRCSSIR